MASPEEKKKILNIRLNEGSSLNALRRAQQERIQTNSRRPEPDTEVSFERNISKTLDKEEIVYQPLINETMAEQFENTDEQETDISSVVEEEYETEDTRHLPRRILDKVLSALSGVVPKRGDPPLEIVRKCVFVVALITLIASVSYIVNDMVIVPVKNEMNNDNISGLYNPNNPVEPPADFTDYPEGIQPAFKALYAQNQDLRGYIKYYDTEKKWLKIDLPVVYSGDNEFYLHQDFNKVKNPNGALFFDYHNKIDSSSSENKALIIYGHNMGSGQMFGSLYRMVQNISYARSAPLIDLDTLYANGQYKVFAVMITSTRPQDEPNYYYMRTSFNGDKDFMDYVANIRARSLYDYNDVDVKPDDQLLLLSTCTAPSVAKFKEGRCVVVARKVRDGESVAVKTSNILKNDDVIMPLAWYKSQNMQEHAFYRSEFEIPGLWTESSNSTNLNTNQPVQPPVTNGTTAGDTTTKKTKTTTTTKKSTTNTAPPESSESENTTARNTEETKPTDPPTNSPTEPTEAPSSTAKPPETTAPPPETTITQPTEKSTNPPAEG